MPSSNVGRKPLFDTDITKPVPVLIEEVRKKIIEAKRILKDISHCVGWKEELGKPTYHINCSLEGLRDIKHNIISIEDEQRKQEEEAGKLPKSYKVNNRGMDTDYTPGCFVCGGEPGLYRTISLVVESKELAKVVSELFVTGVCINHKNNGYKAEVKVGACVHHHSSLHRLSKSVGKYPNIITKTTVEAAMSTG